MSTPYIPELEQEDVTLIVAAIGYMLYGQRYRIEKLSRRDVARAGQLYTRMYFAEMGREVTLEMRKAFKEAIEKISHG